MWLSKNKTLFKDVRVSLVFIKLFRIKLKWITLNCKTNIKKKNILQIEKHFNCVYEHESKISCVLIRTHQRKLLYWSLTFGNDSYFLVWKAWLLEICIFIKLKKCQHCLN